MSGLDLDNGSTIQDLSEQSSATSAVSSESMMSNNGRTKRKASRTSFRAAPSKKNAPATAKTPRPRAPANQTSTGTPLSTPRAFGGQTVARLEEKADNEPSRDRSLPPRGVEWESEGMSDSDNNEDEDREEEPEIKDSTLPGYGGPLLNQDSIDSDAGMTSPDAPDPATLRRLLPQKIKQIEQQMGLPIYQILTSFLKDTSTPEKNGAPGQSLAANNEQVSRDTGEYKKRKYTWKDPSRKNKGKIIDSRKNDAEADDDEEEEEDGGHPDDE